MTQQQYNFHNLYTRFDDQFTPPLPSHVDINIPDAEQRLRAGLDYFVRQFTCGETQHAQWHEENYRPIVQWMTHNHGRGLLLTGTCGLGKTLIGKYIIPILIRDTTRRIVNIFTARDLQARPDEIMQYHLIYIDDIGTENTTNIFGNKRQPLAELVDIAEQTGKLLILTTNLNGKELRAKYGDRTIDRLKAVTTYITLTGKSLRR